MGHAVTVPTLVSTTAGVSTFAGDYGLATVATEPGDLVVLWLSHTDFSVTDKPLVATLHGPTLATPLEHGENVGGANRDRQYALFADVADAVSSTWAFRIADVGDFPRGAYWVCDVIRGGAVDAHSSSFGPGSNWADGATKSTAGSIPGVTTTADDCLVRHYVGAINGNNSFTVPAITFAGWSSGTLADFTAPDGEIDDPTSGSGFLVRATAASTGELLTAGPTGAVDLTATSAVHWQYACLAIRPSEPAGGWVVGVEFR